MHKRVPQYTYLTPEQCQEVELLGFSVQTIRARIKRGMSYEDAISKPIERVSLTETQRQTARENKISMTTVYSRLRNGWTSQQAVNIPVNAHRLLTEEEIETARKNGIGMSTLYNRFYRLEWELEDCINIPLNKNYSRKKGNVS